MMVLDRYMGTYTHSRDGNLVEYKCIAVCPVILEGWLRSLDIVALLLVYGSSCLHACVQTTSVLCVTLHSVATSPSIT